MLRWFRGDKPLVGLLLGIDCAGKTTMLYHLKLGEMVRTIPTIGFNIEDINRGSKGSFTLWDIGGCDQMRGLLRHYFQRDRFILFLHPCDEYNDAWRLDFSLSYFRDVVVMMREQGATHMWVLFTKQDLLPDSEKREIMQRLRALFEDEIRKISSGLVISIVDIPGMNALDRAKLHAVLDHVKDTLDKEGNRASSIASQPKVATAQKSSEVELTTKINEAASGQPTSEIFWHNFQDGVITSWDHYAHLRSGYFVMLNSIAETRSIMDCANEFLGHLSRLRQANPQKFRNTAHRYDWKKRLQLIKIRTMTLFWLSMLQMATLRWQQDTNRTSAKRDDFHNVLLKTPSLMDTNLWRRHYSKGLMFSPKARESWQWPDLDPLPASLLESTSTHRTPSLPQAGNDPDRLIRFALILVQTSMRSSANRGAIIKHALSALERSTIQLRAQKSPVPPYSETQAYFWIQLVHAYLASVDSQTAQDISLVDSKDRFAIAGDEWSEYYSKKSWDGIEARRVFVTPDLKSLLNVIEASKGERRGDLLGKRVEVQEQSALNEAMAILVASALEHDANNIE